MNRILATALAAMSFLFISLNEVAAASWTPYLNVTFNSSQVTYGSDQWTNNYVYLNFSAQNPLTWTGYRNDTLIENTSGLVGRWSFDSVDANNITEDSSGNGNDGILYNYPCAPATCNLTSNAKFGKALQFDGVDDYVDVGNANDNMDFGTGEFSISAWVLAGLEGAYVGIFDAANIDDNIQITLALSNGKPIFTTPVDDDATSTDSIQEDGKWHHLVGVKNSTNVMIYVDGVLMNTDAGSGLNVTDIVTTTIGAFDSGGVPDGLFNGTIDEVRVYNRALSGDEIRELYLAGTNMLGAGTYDYILNTTGNANYSSASVSGSINIAKGTPDLSLTVSPSWSVYHPSFTSVSCSIAPTHLNEVSSFNLSRNDAPVSSPDNGTPGFGTYGYSCNTAPTSNYSSGSVYGVLTVNLHSSFCDRFYDNPSSPSTYSAGNISMQTTCSPEVINVTVEFNGANYTANSIPFTYNLTSGVFLFNITSGPPGSYTYRWISYNNITENGTSMRNLIINNVVSLARYVEEMGGIARSTTHDLGGLTSAGSTKEVFEGDDVNFISNDEVHGATIKRITYTYVELELRSTPANMAVGPGETKKADLNGDGVYDLAVTVNSIMGLKASITFKAISEAIPATTCPACPSAGEWSACTGSQQSRVNYRCSASTNYACEYYTESQPCTEKENAGSPATAPTNGTTPAVQTVNLITGLFLLGADKNSVVRTVAAILLVAGLVVYFNRKRK